MKFKTAACLKTFTILFLVIQPIFMAIMAQCTRKEIESKI